MAHVTDWKNIILIYRNTRNMFDWSAEYLYEC